MLNKIVTIDQMMSWRPGYSREELLELLQGKTELTVAEIINSNVISTEDKLCLLLREEILPAKVLHEFTLWCAETTLIETNVTNKTSWNALKVKRLWLEGKATDDELNAARKAAQAAVDWSVDRALAARVATWDNAGLVVWGDIWAATWDIAGIDAWEVARVAAWDVAWYTTRKVAKDEKFWAVSSDATNITVWNTAWKATREKQLAKLKEMLEEKN
ncbi:MAG TPA: hypothetical protein PKI14_10255 [Fervidobacterium sp.]|nr:hypothetical protein [Fervidobacterium sp.]